MGVIAQLESGEHAGQMVLIRRSELTVFGFSPKKAYVPAILGQNAPLFVR